MKHTNQLVCRQDRTADGQSGAPRSQRSCGGFCGKLRFQPIGGALPARVHGIHDSSPYGKVYAEATASINSRGNRQNAALNRPIALACEVGETFAPFIARSSQRTRRKPSSVALTHCTSGDGNNSPLAATRAFKPWGKGSGGVSSIHQPPSSRGRRHPSHFCSHQLAGGYRPPHQSRGWFAVHVATTPRESSHRRELSHT